MRVFSPPTPPPHDIFSLLKPILRSYNDGLSFILCNTHGKGAICQRRRFHFAFTFKDCLPKELNRIGGGGQIQVKPRNPFIVVVAVVPTHFYERGYFCSDAEPF